MNTRDFNNDQKYRLAARLFDAIEAAEFEEDVADFRAGIGDSTIRIPSLDDIKSKINKLSPTSTEKRPFWLQGRVSLEAILRPALAASDADRDYSDNAIVTTSHFDEKLISRAERDQEGDLRITFQSTDAEFAGKFVRLAAPVVMWLFLSAEVSVPNAAAASLKFHLPLSDQYTKAIDIDETIRPLELKSLLARFNSGEITEDVIRLSVNHLSTRSGEKAWKEVAEKMQGTKLGAIILEALSKNNGGTT